MNDLETHYAIDHWIKEKFTGASLERPRFTKLIDTLKAGDTLVVWDVSRLGRKTAELLTLVEQLKARGVRLVIHKLGVDICSPAGKLVLATMAAIAELEREAMLERQRLGIEAAKKAGKYKGRKPVDEKLISAALKAIGEGMTVKAAANHFKIGEATLYRRRAELRA